MGEPLKIYHKGMRRTDKQRDEAEAWALFAESPMVHLASTDPSGRPTLRALHGVVHDGCLVFHGAHEGDKAG